MADQPEETNPSLSQDDWEEYTVVLSDRGRACLAVDELHEGAYSHVDIHSLGAEPGERVLARKFPDSSGMLQLHYNGEIKMGRIEAGGVGGLQTVSTPSRTVASSTEPDGA